MRPIPVNIWRLLFMASLIAGCSPIVDSVTFKSFPPRPTDAQVDVYREGQPPKCAYEEIGRVTSVKRVHTSMEETMAGLKKRAAEMGGDAVVAVVIRNEGSAVPFVDPAILGTVVVFSDKHCAATN